MDDAPASPADPRANEWITLFEKNLSVLKRHARGVHDAAALVRVGDDGNHFGWLVGHVLVSRDGVLRALGEAPLADEAEHDPYRRGAPLPRDEDAVPFGRLLATLEAQQPRLSRALGAADPDTLARPVGFADHDVASWISFLAWHDTYHLGQAAVYRRAAGLEGVLG